MELKTAEPMEPEAANTPESGERERTMPRHLSPSSASMYKQCPLKWKFRYMDGLSEPPGIPALTGTFAHRVLELLLQEPAESRTVDRARELARQVWPEMETDEDFAALELDDADARKFRWKGWDAIKGLWEVEDPCDVAVYATEQEVKIQVNGVPFKGVIDRVDKTEDGLVVTDYKSGRAPKERYADERLTQVLLYAAALAEIEGRRPVRARLVYLGQRVIEVDVTDDNLEQVTEELRSTWLSVLDNCLTGEFAAAPGPLCPWCAFQEHCPQGQAEVQKRRNSGRLPPEPPPEEYPSDVAVA